MTCSTVSVCTAGVNSKKTTAGRAHSQFSNKGNRTTTTDSKDKNGSFYYVLCLCLCYCAACKNVVCTCVYVFSIFIHFF